MNEGQTSTPSENPLNITVDSNAAYNVTTQSDSTTFTGPGTLEDGNLEWSDTGVGSWTDYDITAAVVASGNSPGASHNLYHQLTIPVDTVAGDYNLGITLKVVTP
jgi:hypothetical protein